MMKDGEKAIAHAALEIWENLYQDRDYTIDITFPEFTCLCPKTGYPDFATINIHYVPDKYIVELRSLKLYMNRFRAEYISHESVTNKIFTDLEEILKPRSMEVVGDFNPRGNVKTVIRVASLKEKSLLRKS